MDAFGRFLSPVLYKRKEREISAKFILKEKSLDLLDEFLSIAELEIIRFVLSGSNVFVCLKCIRPNSLFDSYV